MFTTTHGISERRSTCRYCMTILRLHGVYFIRLCICFTCVMWDKKRSVKDWIKLNTKISVFISKINVYTVVPVGGSHETKNIKLCHLRLCAYIGQPDTHYFYMKRRCF